MILESQFYDGALAPILLAEPEVMYINEPYTKLTPISLREEDLQNQHPPALQLEIDEMSNLKTIDIEDTEAVMMLKPTQEVPVSVVAVTSIGVEALPTETNLVNGLTQSQQIAIVIGLGFVVWYLLKDKNN